MNKASKLVGLCRTKDSKNSLKRKVCIWSKLRNFKNTFVVALFTFLQRKRSGPEAMLINLCKREILPRKSDHQFIQKYKWYIWYWHSHNDHEVIES